jgi:pimeloyl-ACP methyl ester carboxylesterase
MSAEPARKHPGGWLRQVLMVVLALLAAPAVPQARSTAMSLAGRDTLVDVVEPAAGRDGPHRAAVILAHGFTRSRATMAGHAAALARAGYMAVVPDLPYLMDSRDNARALRDLMRVLREGTTGWPPIERFVLVGFSAGGLSALLAADAPGVVGYIGLDPFDRPGGVGLAAARRLAVPVFLLRGPSAACNAYGIADPWIGALPQLVEQRQIAGASHCDFESPTDWICRAVCGDTDPSRQAVVAEFLVTRVRRLLGPVTPVT